MADDYTPGGGSVSTNLSGTGKGLATIQGDGGTGRNLASIPGCEPQTGRVGGSTLISPAAEMVTKLKGGS